MNNAFGPRIAREIWQQYPDYRALSITACGFRVVEGSSLPGTPLRPAPWIDNHIQAWQNAFRKFGSNPKRTPCSVEALWKRLQKTGALPAISPVVDLYNALSIRFGAPFGGEDADQYAGVPELCLATGTEEFDTVKDGVPVMERPESGEVVWQDQRGVTCRRWNWRQCKRTALSDASENLWFVIDRLSPMPVEELLRAGEALIEGLRRLCPAVEAAASLLEPSE